MIRRTRSREILCFVLLVCNLIFIWGNSMLPAEISGALSKWLKALLFSGSTGDGSGDGLLRKIAHFMEFCTLGILLSGFLGMRLPTVCKNVLLCLATGITVACVDELIQRFSAGRNPSIIDVSIDTAGLAVGIALLWLGHHIYKTFQNKHFGGKQQ